MVFQFFAKERAELYWCYEAYEVGQKPCAVRRTEKWDAISVIAYATSLLAFVTSIVPCNVFDLLTGESRQRNVASAIARERLAGTEVRLRDVLIFGGYREAAKSDDDGLDYGEAVKEEYYTRLFSSVSSEIYLNWTGGSRPLSVALTLLFFVSVIVPVACFDNALHVRVWIFALSTTFYLAPIHALVFLLPVYSAPETSVLASTTLLFLAAAKLASLAVSKSVESSHEKRLLRLNFKARDNWLTDIEENRLLYFLGYEGYF
jgi:hypothetical protein